MIEARHEFFVHDGVVGSFTNVFFTSFENLGNIISTYLHTPMELY